MGVGGGPPTLHLCLQATCWQWLCSLTKGHISHWKTVSYNSSAVFLCPLRPGGGNGSPLVVAQGCLTAPR